MSSTGMLGAVNWGSSLFQRTNREIVQNGQSMTATISKQDNSFTDVSNFGSEVKIGKGEFTRVSGRIFSDGSHLAKSISDGAQAYVDTLTSRMQNGKSRFVKSNEYVSLRSLQNA